MIELIDFNDCEENKRTYGGNGGRKASILFENSSWIIKYPSNVKKIADFDCSTSPISEYIGSNIYNFLEIPVQQTILGTFDKKIVVACKDFCENDKLLSEFKTFKVTYRKENVEYTSGDGTNLYDVLNLIGENKILNNVDGIKERFWTMFVVDAFIGNPDRNNDNWGLLVTFPEREIIGLAPVYDNGNCLNSKWDDFRMKNFLKEMSNDQKILNSSISIYFDENDDRIRPFNFINQTNIDKCLKSVVSICEKINIDVINSFIEDLYKSKIISELCADFYQKLLTKRYEVALKSNYEYSMEYLHHTHKTKFSGVHLF